jgi:long-subunit acyl-CoA synthetase (AMP-forming)
VEHVLVWGDQTCTAPLVLATVDVEEVRKLGDPELPMQDEAALRQHPVLAEHLRRLLLAEADAAGVPPHERPQKLVLLPEPLSEENGTLTRGLRKIVPGTVMERYRDLIARAAADG